VPAHPLSYPSGQSVVLESYAMGKPVVCVRSAAMRDYAVEGASSSYEPGDADDLADAVRRTFDLPREERDERGAVAREAAVRRFSNPTMWAAVATVLDTVSGRAA
jgi:glycosyltransferase involved in cell wall biosynthesis